MGTIASRLLALDGVRLFLGLPSSARADDDDDDAAWLGRLFSLGLAGRWAGRADSDADAWW